MSKTNETRHIKWHEKCKSIWRLDATVCKNKQRCNNDKRRCQCKELIDKGVCDEGYAWNPSNYECECDKSCDIGEYLDYENCKCTKRLVDKLVDECDENIEETNLVKINSIKCKNNSCILYIVLLFNILCNKHFWSVLILFTMDTWMVLKKMFLYMIMFIKRKIIIIEWEKQNK